MLSGNLRAFLSLKSWLQQFIIWSWADNIPMLLLSHLLKIIILPISQEYLNIKWASICAWYRVSSLQVFTICLDYLMLCNKPFNNLGSWNNNHFTYLWFCGLSCMVLLVVLLVFCHLALVNRCQLWLKCPKMSVA